MFNRTRCTSQTLYFPDCPLRVTNALSRAATAAQIAVLSQPTPLPSQSTGCTTSRRLQRCLRRRGHNVAVQAPELPAAHFIRINTGARADLMWWHTFLQDWNGTSFFPATTTSVEVISDASGSWGCGAFVSNLGWFQLQWPDSWQTTNIAAKELVPIVIAAALWGHHWSGAGVCFRSDNMAVVSILSTRTSRHQLLMHLLHCLTFYAAYFRFTMKATHIPGTLNTAADAISRNNIPLFLSLVPHTQQFAIPQPLVDLLVTRRPDWGSQAWTHLFVNSLSRDLPQQPVQSTAPAGANI